MSWPIPRPWRPPALDAGGLSLRKCIVMRIALMVPDLNPMGDAVGNDVVGMHGALTARGFSVRIFVAAPRETGTILAFSYGELGQWLRAGDILIYHYATADDAGLRILETTPAHVILRYHNVTPPEYFEGYSTEYEQATRDGRAAICRLAGIPRLTLMPASYFSATELERAGLKGRKVHVLPPYHHAEDMLDCSGVGSQADHTVGEFNLLSVGRIAPHKRVDCLIEIVSAARKRTGHDIALTVVGTVDSRLTAYKQELENLIDARGLGSAVRFVQGVSQSVLGECYRNADLVVTASEHEGFWVPGVEAMAFSKPIAALGRAAVPETCAGAAILCDTVEGMQQAIDHLRRDPLARAELGSRGRARYENEFAPEVIDRKFVAGLLLPARSWSERLFDLSRRFG